jgi:hypothetical protein
MSDSMPMESAIQAPASKSLPARFLGVLFSPRETYAAVAARPSWFGVMAVVALIGAIGTFAFLSTEVGRQATLDQQIRAMESFGVKTTDVMLQRMEDSIGNARYFGAASQFIFFPLISAILAGVLLGVFNALLGGDAGFKQVFAIIAHSGVVISVSQAFVLPLDYVRETLSSPTNLAVFLPFLDENTFPARFLGMIDLFQVWWLVSLAIGLGVLYKKRTGPIAWSLLGIYMVIGLIIAAIKSAV